MAKTLMVAAEAMPFISTGGLGDVLGGLPPALVQQGETVAVVLPLYRGAQLRDARTAYERLGFSVANRGYLTNIQECVRGGVRYFFVQEPGLYDRPGVYTDEEGRPYPDNHVRFAALCQAALRIAHHVFAPDIIHCHDWPTGLLPVLLRRLVPHHPAYLGLKTIFTVHNVGYQGLFPLSTLAELGLPGELGRPDELEFYGQVSWLKGGLLHADRLTTVSRRYAQEIQTPEFGFGLEGVLQARRGVLAGITNGVAYNGWDPSQDPAIPQRYDAGDPAGKQACKTALLAELGLPAEAKSRPLFAILSRLVEQKGFDLFMQIAEQFARLEATLVVHGSGEQRFEDFFRWYGSTYPDRAATRIGYDPGFMHRVAAGADVLLMPSRYEPCGLQQIYSMRYGTLPLVRATGGLDDTVDSDSGWKFASYDAGSLLSSIHGALSQWNTPAWDKLRAVAMRKDYSWAFAAKQYRDLYQQLRFH